MPRLVQCSGCGRALSVREEYIGARLRCPACRWAFVAGPERAVQEIVEAEIVTTDSEALASGAAALAAVLGAPSDGPDTSLLGGPPEEHGPDGLPMQLDEEPARPPATAAGPVAPALPGSSAPGSEPETYPTAIPLEPPAATAGAALAPTGNGASESPLPAEALPPAPRRSRRDHGADATAALAGQEEAHRRGRRRRSRGGSAAGGGEVKAHRSRLIRALAALSVFLALVPLWLIPFGGIAIEVAAVAFGNLARTMGSADLLDMELGAMDASGKSGTWKGWAVGTLGVGLGVVAFVVALLCTVGFVTQHTLR